MPNQRRRGRSRTGKWRNRKRRAASACERSVGLARRRGGRGEGESRGGHEPPLLVCNRLGVGPDLAGGVVEVDADMGLAPGGGEQGDGEAWFQHETGGGRGEVLGAAGIPPGLGGDPLIERLLGGAGDVGG